MNNAKETKDKMCFDTIDGATLMSSPLQPLRFVVDSLISQGLHVLAGSPKVGKSWLALWLSVMVAKGEYRPCRPCTRRHGCGSPPLGRGKQSVRLYAVRIKRGAAPHPSDERSMTWKN